MLSILLLAAVADPGSNLPNGHAWGCLPGNISAGFPFCDPTLTVAERVKDLVSRLSLDEKIGFVTHATCMWRHAARVWLLRWDGVEGVEGAVHWSLATRSAN
jgi:hypothetical protein